MQPFNLYLPTRLVYGKDRIGELDALTKNYGSRVLLVAGTGSAKRSGLIDKVKAALPGREIYELEGVVPNPRIDSVRAGAALCKEKNVDFILAVGGGSVIDCSKAIAAAAVSDLEAWELVKAPAKIEKALPLFTVLTLAATGSEYDNSAVISNPDTKEKLGMGNDLLAPVASICDPSLSVSVPAYHTAAGIADIMSHTFEQYIVMEGNPVSDGIDETILRTCIEMGPRAVKNPTDEEARAAIMLASSFGCNGLLALGLPGPATGSNMKSRLSTTSPTAWALRSSRRTGCATASPKRPRRALRSTACVCLAWIPTRTRWRWLTRPSTRRPSSLPRSVSRAAFRTWASRTSTSKRWQITCPPAGGAWKAPSARSTRRGSWRF